MKLGALNVMFLGDYKKPQVCEILSELVLLTCTGRVKDPASGSWEMAKSSPHSMCCVSVYV